MINKHYTMTFPETGYGYNRVAVIEAVRQLTGLGLTEAKDLTYGYGPQLVQVQVLDLPDPDTQELIPADVVLEKALRVLLSNGVIVVEAVRSSTLEEVRKLASDALMRDELDMAVALLEVLRKFK